MIKFENRRALSVPKTLITGGPKPGLSMSGYYYSNRLPSLCSRRPMSRMRCERPSRTCQSVRWLCAANSRIWPPRLEIGDQFVNGVGTVTQHIGCMATNSHSWTYASLQSAEAEKAVTAQKWTEQLRAQLSHEEEVNAELMAQVAQLEYQAVALKRSLMTCASNAKANDAEASSSSSTTSCTTAGTQAYRTCCLLRISSVMSR